MGKKIIAALAACGLIAASMAVNMSVGAASPKIPHSIEWTGGDLPSVSVSCYGVDKFTGIMDENDAVVDSSSYTATGDETSTNIIFNEDYLKTLENGEHNYCACFTINDWVFNPIRYVMSADESDPSVFRADLSDSDLRFETLFDSNGEVDSSFYSVSTVDGNVEVTLNQEYIDKNQETSPSLSFSVEEFRETEIEKIILNVSNDGKSVSPSEDTASDNRSTDSPKTGNNGIGAVALVAACSGAAAAALRKRK